MSKRLVPDRMPHEEILARFEAANAYIGGLEADKARMDWLEEHRPDVLWAMASEPFMVYLDDPGKESARHTLRECIDAQMGRMLTPEAKSGQSDKP